MNEYTPDRWIIIEIKQEGEEPWRRILSAWYGGYLGANSWRLSSGITKIIEHEKHYEIHNESGSIYTCYKTSIGTSSLSASILNSWSAQADERDDFEISVIGVEELLTKEDY